MPCLYPKDCKHSKEGTCNRELKECPNIIIIKTLSKFENGLLDIEDTYKS